MDHDAFGLTALQDDGNPRLVAQLLIIRLNPILAANLFRLNYHQARLLGVSGQPLVVLPGHFGEIGSVQGFDVTLVAQKPHDGATARSMKLWHQAVADDTIKTRVAKADQVAMMLDKAVHGGPPRDWSNLST